IAHKVGAARRAGAGCPTCGRPWQAEPPDPAALAQLDRDHQHAPGLLTSTNTELLELQRLRAVAEREWSLYDSLASSRERARQDHALVVQELAAARERARHAGDAVLVDEAVLGAFAPTGPRAQLLSSAITRISAAATRW